MQLLRHFLLRSSPPSTVCRSANCVLTGFSPTSMAAKNKYVLVRGLSQASLGRRSHPREHHPWNGRCLNQLLKRSELGPLFGSVAGPKNATDDHRLFSSDGTNNIIGSNDNVPAEKSSLNENSEKIITSSESGDLSRAQEILDSLEADAISGNDKDYLPDIDSYTALMNAFVDRQQIMMTANKSDKESDSAETILQNLSKEIMSLAENAYELLIRMEDFSGVSDHYSTMRYTGEIKSTIRQPNLRPTSHHYDCVLSAFSNVCTNMSDKSSHRAPFVAQRLLERMETLAFDQHSGVTPTVDSYYHVMEAWAATGEKSTVTKNNRAPIMVQQIFDKLKKSTNLKPTARECRLFLRTWCNSSSIDAAYKGTVMWFQMVNSLRGGIEDMEPTLEDGKLVLQAWSRAINKQSARRAFKVLTTMNKLHSSKKSAVKPDLDCYRAVLITLSRSKQLNAANYIPTLFKEMDEDHILPDTQCFNAAIETLKNRATHPDASNAEEYAKLCEDKLDQMERMYHRSSVSIVKPSAETYTNVIKALSVKKQKRAAIKADALLRKMESEYANGDASLKPTRDSYLATIHAYANCSRMESSFVHANEVLQRMNAQFLEGNEDAKPDICSYHAVINACASSATNSSTNKKEAVLMAIRTVQNMKKMHSVNPNSKSYLLLLECCGNLLPSGVEREKSLRSIFRSCCRDGLVNAEILKYFQGAVSADAYHQEVIADAPTLMGVQVLPEKWTRNLGYRVRMNDSEGGQRPPVFSVYGDVILSSAYNDYRMRRRLTKKNQKLLRGGRTQ